MISHKCALTEGSSLYEQLRILAIQRNTEMDPEQQHIYANSVVRAWGNDPCRDSTELESLYDDFLTGIWNTNDNRPITGAQQRHPW